MLWIGTLNGLNRYDGNEMTGYYHDEKDSTSLPDNNIYFITQDLAGNIWVGTGAGLALFEPYTNSFYHSKPYNSGSRDVYCSALKIGSKMIFGSTDHLSIYNTLSNSFDILKFHGEKTSLSLIYKMVQWHDQKLLIASPWHGLFIVDLNSGEVKKAPFCEETNILDIYLDSENNLWLSLLSKGIVKYNWNGKQLENYTTSNSGLSNSTVLSMKEINQNLWLGTDGGGINILNPKEKTIQDLQEITKERLNNQLNSITTIYVDSYSNVWFGTVRGGIFGMRQSGIYTYTESYSDANYGLSNPTVLALAEDNQNIIWLGTDGGGINEFDPETGTFKHFPNTFTRKVNAVTNFSDRELLINCYEQGLFIFNKKAGTVTPFNPLTDNHLQIPGKGRAGTSLFNFENKEIYIFHDAVYLYDFVPGKLKILDFPDIKANEGILKIAGSIGNKIIVYGNKSVYELNAETKELTLLFGSADMENNGLLSACVDPDGIIWAGCTNGLYRYSNSKKLVKPFESQLFNEITCIEADNNSRLWFGTGSNLISYQKYDNSYKIYGRSDGVLQNNYLPKAKLRSKIGDVYLGGVNGLVHVKHDYVINPGAENSPQIISLLQDGTIIDNKRFSNFKETRKITLPNNVKSFIVRIFVNDPDLLSKKYIRYSIKGYNEQPIETSDMNIDLPKLPYGKYSLLVSSKLSGGPWSQPEELLQIRVLPPWWLTWWSLSLFFILIMLSLFLLRYSIYQKARNKMQMELIRKENHMNEQRIQFLINISHELRTPLSLVYGPLERILKGQFVSEEEKVEMLQQVMRHVNYIRNLVDQLMDFRRMDKVAGVLEPTKTDFNDWLEKTVEEFGSIFKDTAIQITFNLDKAITYVTFDNDKLKKVVYNFLMNILKHAPGTSEIIITTELTRDQNVKVSIADDGPGIPEDKLQKVFDRFYMIEEQKGNSGIGLAFSKMMIEQHDGHIGVKNREVRGADFYFEIPVNPFSHKNEELKIQPEHDEVLSLVQDSDQIRQQDSSGAVGEIVKRDLVILLVEDNPELLKFMKSSLSPYFKKVLTSLNGKEALISIKNVFPDIIVSDIMMPEMDGWELCKNIKSNIEISHIPIILLTARSSETDTLRSYKLGADHYLTKPLSIDLLLSVVDNIINRRVLLRKKYQENHQFITPEEITFSNADEKFLTTINSIIEKEIEDKELSVDFLVDKMAMSRASLYTKMKAITGTGINTYINNYKIEYARRLLTTTDWPISEISSKLGYTSQGYFSTQFRQATGISPNDYRKTHSHE